MIEGHKYKYAGRSLAYYGDTVTLLKIEKRGAREFYTIKFSNGVIFPDVPEADLKRLNK